MVRNGKIVEDNMKLAGLRSFKKEVSEVKEGNECGLSFVSTYQIIKGDVLEFYKMNE
jgi:translation initiation factor IF-2